MREQIEILRELDRIRDNGFAVCIFGCGNLGKGVGYDILKYLNINIDYYTDNDPQTWGEIRDGIRCIEPSELLCEKDIAYFVMVGGAISRRNYTAIEEA